MNGVRSIEVYSCGMPVTIDGQIEGKIAEIAIGVNDQIQYRIVWVKDGTRNSSWVQSFEVEPAGEEYKTMLKVLNFK
ncbi:hypothetical protein KKI24_07155 [bacterium]|nr:hypothetical protein [bacterium]